MFTRFIKSKLVEMNPKMKENHIYLRRNILNRRLITLLVFVVDFISKKFAILRLIRLFNSIATWSIFLIPVIKQVSIVQETPANLL
jgi:hypothetical protein